MIRSAISTDLPLIRRLLQENRHCFLTCGIEDLPSLVDSAMTAVGVSSGEENRVWGFVAFDTPSSAALSGSLQDGALRVAAIGRNIPTGASADQLFSHILESLQTHRGAVQLTALPDETWLVRLLKDQQFTVVDHLCLYQRTRHSLPSSTGSALLRPLQRTELADLARLDNLAFSPLWRMAEAELLELIFTCRIQAAEVEGTLVGYAATSLQPAQDRYDEAQAQLSRLAVHPVYQGRRIGRQLLIDAIAYAHAQGCYRVLLNTPESNLAARHLYGSVHFRRYGARVPVFVYQQEAVSM